MITFFWVKTVILHFQLFKSKITQKSFNMFTDLFTV